MSINLFPNHLPGQLMRASVMGKMDRKAFADLRVKRALEQGLFTRVDLGDDRNVRIGMVGRHIYVLRGEQNPKLICMNSEFGQIWSEELEHTCYTLCLSNIGIFGVSETIQGVEYTIWRRDLETGNCVDERMLPRAFIPLTKGCFFDSTFSLIGFWKQNQVRTTARISTSLDLSKMTIQKSEKECHYLCSQTKNGGQLNHSLNLGRVAALQTIDRGHVNLFDHTTVERSVVQNDEAFFAQDIHVVRANSRRWQYLVADSKEQKIEKEWKHAETFGPIKTVALAVLANKNWILGFFEKGVEATSIDDDQKSYCFQELMLKPTVRESKIFMAGNILGVNESVSIPNSYHPRLGERYDYTFSICDLSPLLRGEAPKILNQFAGEILVLNHDYLLMKDGLHFEIYDFNRFDHG